MYWEYHSGMEWARWIDLLRYPLEIISLALAAAPALMVLQAWATLPKKIPVRFGSTGRPDRWGSRARAWVLPILALIVYGFMSRATGTWAWLLDGKAGIPAGSELLMVLKPGVALLMMNVTGMLIRVARRDEESLNGWLLWGLMILLVTPPLAMSIAVR